MSVAFGDALDSRAALDAAIAFSIRFWRCGRGAYEASRLWLIK